MIFPGLPQDMHEFIQTSIFGEKGENKEEGSYRQSDVNAADMFFSSFLGEK